MAMYRDGFIVLLNLLENGVERPYKLIWNDIGKPLEWVEGDSGFQELLDSRDQITAAKPFGQDLVIYRTRSMVLMSFVGIGNTIFEFNNLVYGESVGTEAVGAVSPNAVYARADAHIILDRRGIFVYQGGLTVSPISNDIFSGTFDESGDMDTDQTDKEFLFFLDESNELYCFYKELNT